ncbi:MAG: tRNA epoxyqueuosine(34) reductase QueG [Terriglobia bacterium]|jgi:epoxyqueuosine reductase
MRLASTIKQRALEVGFDLAGIAPPSALKDLEFLSQWVEKGFAGEMRYLVDPRREDSRRVLPSVKSMICVGLVYNTPHPYSTDIADSAEGKKGSSSRGAPTGDTRSRGWISRYAWGSDYHVVMRTKLEQLRTILEHLAGGVETRVYVDTGPIVERAFARLSGIGWMGKNTCLINEQKGSWFFLGVILTNLELELDLPAPDRCGSCTRCLEACPTGALVEPYVMDASRCISYFNIELKGVIPEKFRKAIGSNVFGCDICQDVCPWNGRPLSLVSGLLQDDAARGEQSGTVPPQRHAATTALPNFQPLQVEIKPPLSQPAADPEPNSHPLPAESFSLFNPHLEALASLREEDFRTFFARSPIKRVKHRGWLRNLCVAIGNSRDRRFIAWLEDAARHPDAMVREHALWALRQLQTAE